MWDGVLAYGFLTTELVREGEREGSPDQILVRGEGAREAVGTPGSLVLVRDGGVEGSREGSMNPQWFRHAVTFWAVIGAEATSDLQVIRPHILLSGDKTDGQATLKWTEIKLMFPTIFY